MKYDVYYRPLWEWVTDLIQSPQLSPYFHWDAEKISRCYGESSIRVFNEPWSADAFWDLQVRISSPPVFESSTFNAPRYRRISLLAGIPSASFYMLTRHAFQVLGWHKGTQWLHVVPTFPRISETAMVSAVGVSLDGFQSYVYVPISSAPLIVFQVHETPSNKKKAEFVTLKRTVWHQSFSVIVESITTHSNAGCWMSCADGVKRWLFPTVLMLSADYEEQYAFPQSFS